jgi:hypothetical protein
MFGINRKKLTPLDGARKVFLDVLPVCGVCNRPIAGHLFKQIAVTPTEQNDSKQGLALIDAVKHLDWEKIVSFQEFKGTLPAVVVYALKCPTDACSLAAVLSTSELWEDDVLLHQQQVPDCAHLGAEGYLGPI